MRFYYSSSFVAKAIALGAFVALTNTSWSEIYDFEQSAFTDQTGERNLVLFNPFGSGVIPPPASGSFELVDGKLALSATHFGGGTSLSPDILGLAVGPTRIGIMNSSPARDFKVSIDVLDLGSLGATGESASHLLAGRIVSPGLGTTSGIVLQFGRLEDELFLSMGRVRQELLMIEPDSEGQQFYGLPSYLLPEGLDGRGYRLTLQGRGTEVEGSVADLAAPERPLATLTRHDPEPVPGLTGYIVTRQISAEVSVVEAPVVVEVDNFQTEEPDSRREVPRLEIARAYRLSWEAEPGQYRVERANRLDSPWAEPENTLVREIEGGIEAFVYIDRKKQFFRLRPIGTADSPMNP